MSESNIRPVAKKKFKGRSHSSGWSVDGLASPLLRNEPSTGKISMKKEDMMSHMKRRLSSTFGFGRDESDGKVRVQLHYMMHRLAAK